ncbi:MAG: excinuclease ABC subunit UvrA [Bacteroidota bacterium]|nr:excinuclease ABC subunit UvrA [Bacteroidota bacterium]
MEEKIVVKGAREHNLKNIDVSIPRNALTVITGLSGSGKSSLAFDTLHAEGQRRYIETFSAYARQFIGGMDRPDVDKVDGLSPVVAIEQKTTSKSPRSTVGTITELYDFFRLLYARTANAYSSATQELMVQYSDEEIVSLIHNDFNNHKVILLAPVVRSRKGHYRELFSNILKQGFTKVRVDGEFVDLKPGYKVDRYKLHDIEIVIDRLLIDRSIKSSQKQLKESLQTAMYHGKNTVILWDQSREESRFFSRNLMCPTTGIAYPNPEPNSFSFNSPKGMCQDCSGLGMKHEVNLNKVIPNDSVSIHVGGIKPAGSFKNNWTFKQFESIAQRYKFSLKDPIKSISKQALDVILYGGNERFSVASKTLGLTREYMIDYDGIVPFIEAQFKDAHSSSLKRWAKSFMDEIECPTCHGSRLNEAAMCFRLADKNISEISSMGLIELARWVNHLDDKISEKQKAIAAEIIKEIQKRIQFLLDVGLDYLTLHRSSKSLSGGEAQRIRLATQIGAQLTGVLYILDEPSIGLHQRDNDRLIDSLISLRDIGNTVIVVEHDKEMMERADHLIDLGPKAGRNGGEIIAQGTPRKVKQLNTMTSAFLNGKEEISIPKKRRKGNAKSLTLTNCQGHNLKNISVSFPLATMIGITGVSGSGKSTLINETLYPILNKYFFNGVKEPLPYGKITGLEHIDKVIDINQTPIGRTPRSNPATYTGVFSEIRSLFTKTPEAQIRGYKPGRFSFNVVSGRCETCQGAGLKTIVMNFLPDVYVPCDDCQGKRFNRETLEVRYRNKTINDVLNMTINEACLFFESIPKIYRKLKTIKDVGLGYISLGQQSTTLSGGEAQRIKLASELSKKDTGKTFYILDEPTTGLHFDDIRVLLEVLQKLVDKGNTVVVIEHNLDVIKTMDYIIDIGPEGGANGGEIVCAGTPEKVSSSTLSHTAKYLKQELNQ